MKPKKYGLLYSVFYLEDGRLLDISGLGKGGATVRESGRWVPFHGTVGQMRDAEPLNLAQLVALLPGTLPSRYGQVFHDSLFRAPDGTLFDISPIRDGQPPRKRAGDRWVPFTLPEDWIKKSRHLTTDEQDALPDGVVEDE